MKNVLFVVKSYSTHNRPNAMCVEMITQHINDIHIDYLSIESQGSDILENNVMPVYDKNTIFRKKIIRKINKFIYAPISDLGLVRIIYEGLCKQISIKKYDTIVAVCNPPEIVEALYYLKKTHPKIKTLVYEIDSNSNRYKDSNSLIENYLNYRSYRWEIRRYNLMDKIIHMRSHEKHYESAKFNSLKEKFVYMDIPYFEPIEGLGKSNTVQKKGEIRLIYAGAFYPKLRDPQFMIGFIAKMRQESNLIFDIYTGNKMRDELNTLASPYTFVTIKNEISQKELLNEISQADVLVSVGNKKSDFLPSKILFYMSTGKKIIHFYPQGDIAVDYLKKYPNACLISQEEKVSIELIKKVIEFIEKDEEVVDMKILREVFKENTPIYSAEKFKEILTCLQ